MLNWNATILLDGLLYFFHIVFIMENHYNVWFITVNIFASVSVLTLYNKLCPGSVIVQSQNKVNATFPPHLSDLIIFIYYNVLAYIYYVPLYLRKSTVYNQWKLYFNFLVSLSKTLNFSFNTSQSEESVLNFFKCGNICIYNIEWL